MPTPDTKHSLVVIKQGTYRGQSKQWTNRYHFEGDLPGDDAVWETLADNVTDAEQLVYSSDTTIIGAIGYDAGSATSTNPHGDSVWSKTYAKVGSFSPAVDDNPCPGDAVGLIRYATTARSAKNHPVYLFSYMHAAFNRGDNADNLAADYKAVLETYGQHWVDGFFDSVTTRERCGPRGALAVSRRVDPFVRHRDFRN